jgi:hypothetical protein
VGEHAPLNVWAAERAEAILAECRTAAASA